MKKPSMSECEFTVIVEPELDDPEGHFASGDDELDAADAAEIRERLQSGDETAWCTVIVCCEYDGEEGIDSLGAVSTTPDGSYGIDQVVADHDMRQQAYDALLAALAARCPRCRGTGKKELR